MGRDVLVMAIELCCVRRYLCRKDGFNLGWKGVIFVSSTEQTFYHLFCYWLVKFSSAFLNIFELGNVLCVELLSWVSQMSVEEHADELLPSNVYHCYAYSILIGIWLLDACLVHRLLVRRITCIYNLILLYIKLNLLDLAPVGSTRGVFCYCSICSSTL